MDINENGWHTPSMNEGLRLARVCNGTPLPFDVEMGANNRSPTDDAWIRACRALDWRTAELRAHGIEPTRIPENAPQHPPAWYDFGAKPKIPMGWALDELERLLVAARGCEFDLTPADGPIAQLTLFMHQQGELILAELQTRA